MADRPRTVRNNAGAFSKYGIFGVALLVLALLGMILNFTLPWTSVSGETQDRGDLTGPGTPDYVGRLTGWPVVSFVFLMILGAGLVVLDLVPTLKPAMKDMGRAGALGVAAFFAFLLALTGFRWLGIYVTQLLDPGPAQHLHVVPYLNLVLGAGFLAGAVVLARRALATHLASPSRSAFGTWAVRIPALTMAVVAAGLLLFPLLPYGSEDAGGDTAYYDEANFAVFSELSRDSGAPEEKPGNDLGWVRIMMWITLYASFATLAFALVERTGWMRPVPGLLVQVYGLTVVPLLVAVIFTILAYVHIPGIDGVSLAFNYFPILAVVGLGVLYWRYVQHVLMPFVKTVQRPSGTTGRRTVT